MRSQSAFVRGIQQLLGREHADPRVAQYLFLIPVLVDLAYVRLHGSSALGDRYLGGLCVAAVATVLAVLIGRGLFAERASVLVPLLDIAALGVLRLDPESAATALLVFPAIWMGLQFGRRGMGLVAIASALAMILPTALREESDMLRAMTVQQVVVALLCALVVTVTAEMWQSKVTEAADAQRMLERAVADSADQRRFNEAILNSVDVGLVALDARGAVHSVNPRHQRFLETSGAADGQLDQLGRTFGPDGFNALAAEELPTWRATHGETLRDYVIWVGASAADRRAFAVSVSPFFTQNGTFDGAVLAYHEITELMTAARLKDEFVATVSHELRTPLTSIVGYVDVLLEDIDGIPVEARPFLETVQRNARRLHRLVDDLLSDALKLGKAELHLGRISLAAVVRASAVEAEKTAHAAGLGFEVEIGRAILEVQGDAERLAQVIDNVFNNAVKFTPPGGTVSGFVKRDGRVAVIRISDTGRGIPPEELEDVFMKFFRSPGVQLDAIPGTGLGLAISKTIIEAHGGTISVDSTVGLGTTLEIRLPLAGPRVARSS
ncbi:sensor histidine kinase [Nocardioides marmoriginsengisoli]|uniref:histidine kinase n=1 Tax=Nocardioides marmoriginsengisoli TaxID=661483 RepID=A0A3N0CNU3_9ACTN|nr:HAMP domain-containing sensor histidine kinase [Nocardioides marmoriginsengisoli]RNL64971.1 sensor histidine kinase [Nocardioides marmoriginsengisoli]